MRRALPETISNLLEALVVIASVHICAIVKYPPCLMNHLFGFLQTQLWGSLKYCFTVRVVAPLSRLVMVCQVLMFAA